MIIAIGIIVAIVLGVFSDASAQLYIEYKAKGDDQLKQIASYGMIGFLLASIIVAFCAGRFG